MKEEIYTLFGGVIVVLLVFGIILGMPFAQIWAVNTLFKTGIEYNLVNWFAMILLNSFFTRVSANSKK